MKLTKDNLESLLYKCINDDLKIEKLIKLLEQEFNIIPKSHLWAEDLAYESKLTFCKIKPTEADDHNFEEVCCVFFEGYYMEKLENIIEFKQEFGDFLNRDTLEIQDFVKDNLEITGYEMDCEYWDNEE